MAAIVDQLKTDLRDDEFCEGYSESFLDSYVATQIKVLREQREMTQKQLAEVLKTSQTVISRIESINYSAWNIGTLKRLARAFKVRLKVSFETCGSLVDDFERFNRANLERAPRDRDPILFDLTEALPADALVGSGHPLSVSARGASNGLKVVFRGAPGAQRDFSSREALSPVVSKTQDGSQLQSGPSQSEVNVEFRRAVNG